MNQPAAGISGDPPVLPPAVFIDPADGTLRGEPVEETVRRLADLQGAFQEEAARAAMPQDQLVYRVECWLPVPEGTPGGLFYGVTVLEPGAVAGECFMTKGHFHAQRHSAEFYWCHRGQGLLLLMDENRHCRVERMSPGSLHYVPGRMAHRTVNVGDERLFFDACWPSEAGHDYASIARDGFSLRVFREASGLRILEVG